MAGLLFPGILATLLAPNVDVHIAPPASLARAIVDPFQEFFSRLGWKGLLVLGFILLFKVPEAMATGMFTPFLLNGAGFTKTQVGFFQNTLGVSITVIGALAGGAIIARWGMIRSLWINGILSAASNAQVHAPGLDRKPPRRFIFA